MRKPLLLSGLLAATLLFLSATLDLDNLFNYENQNIPGYINQDNTTNNAVTDEGVTLGRVLFYDKKLSVSNTVSCASCHQQAFAFSDPLQASVGVNGTTGRHSMRLVNARFAAEDRFFWDERAPTLEAQTTQPIQDHAEMGYSGENGAPDLNDLITELSQVDYYQDLFTFAFGDPAITEARMQQALGQFIRSIQSFDSRFDEGLAQRQLNQPFPNFTDAENRGKALYLGPARCQPCHRAPEFDIDPNSRNNGVVGVIGNPNAIDVNNTRAPSLRDLVNPDGVLNGPLMHDGSMNSLLEVIDHYDDITIVPGNNNLDPRLRGGPPGQGNGQNLNLTVTEKEDLVAFLMTLTGSDIYTNDKWSDPFGPNGELELIGGSTLPVELISFSGSVAEKWNYLTWETATETDFSHFELERSVDGFTNWVMLTEQLGGGAQVQQDGSRSYAFTDQSPLNDGYYRLRLVDLDGAYALSEVIYLQRS
ncbi:MAG: cytochrome c peroxidase, partial [Bacteroidota bacterium]